MGKYHEPSVKVRIQKLEKLIKDCEKIMGFSRAVIQEYKRQLEECKESVKLAKRIYVK